MEEIQIKISKKKLLFLFLVGIGFLLLSFLFSTQPSSFVNRTMRSEELVFIVGCIGLIMFGILSIFLFIKLFDSKPGLVINNEGIIDNASANPAGFIKWSDVISIGTKKVMSVQFILIQVKNPEEYIEKANRVNKIALKQNNREHGTPLVITSTSLQCNFN